MRSLCALLCAALLAPAGLRADELPAPPLIALQGPPLQHDGRAAPLRALVRPADEVQAVVAGQALRPEPAGEPARALLELFISAAVFTGANAGAAALLESSPIRVGKSGVDFQGGEGRLIGAGAIFVASPFLAALSSYLVGSGSDRWQPGLGWATLGAYGTSAVAVAAGLALATTDLDRNSQVLLNSALFLAVPTCTVLLQNAMKHPRPPQP